MDKRDIGLYSVGSLLLLLVDFGIGTMPAVFHSLGNLPFDNESVNNLASGSAMLSAVALSINAEMLSRPLALLEMKDFNRVSCQITK